MKKLYLRLAAVFAVFLALMGGLFAGGFFLRALQENRHFLDQLLRGLQDNLARALDEEEEKRELLAQDYLNRAWAVEYILWDAAVSDSQLEAVRQLMEVEGIALLDQQGRVLRAAGQFTGPEEAGPAFEGQGERVVIDPGSFGRAPAYLYAQVLSGKPGRARVRLDARADRLGLSSGSELVGQVVRASTTGADTLLAAVDGNSGELLALSAGSAQTVTIQGGEDPAGRLAVLQAAAEKQRLVFLTINGQRHTALVRAEGEAYLLAATRLGGVLAGAAATLAQGLAAMAALGLLALAAVRRYLKRYLFARLEQMEAELQSLLAGQRGPLAPEGAGELPELRSLARTLEQLGRDYVHKSEGIHRMAGQLTQARTEAGRDQLTGLCNRSGFERRARAFLEQGGRGVLLLFDLDNFKRVNDGEGHPEGDRVLARFARCLQANFRKGDCIARLGGDEFVVLLTDPMSRPALEEKLATVLASARGALAGCREKHGVSVSVGAVMADGAAQGYDSLYRCADTALYIAKYLGKDCFYINDKGISCMRRVCVGCRRDCPRSEIIRQPRAGQTGGPGAGKGP